jgi:hypothetical protein
MLRRRQEQRMTLRRPMRRGAQAIFNASEPPIPCIIWDMSDRGARLALTRPHKDLPPSFTLVLCKAPRLERKCEIVWIGPRFIGVKFL